MKRTQDGTLEMATTTRQIAEQARSHASAKEKTTYVVTDDPRWALELKNEMFTLQ
jgi:hypothetical protein